MLALIIREPWIGKILDGEKIWEIRSRNTQVRGRIGLIRSQSGLIVGQTELVETFPVTKDQLLKNLEKHGMSGEEVLSLFRPGSNYRKPWAWVMQKSKRFARPKPYRHPQGAVIWVRIQFGQEAPMPTKRKSWKKTEPPKREVRPVRLRYQGDRGTIRQGNFVWSNSEGTWLEIGDPEGVGLYKEDGWKVLGWR